MTDTKRKQLGKPLWGIASDLRGAMDADDFRDYMLSFLFLRYLSNSLNAALTKLTTSSSTPPKTAKAR
jgi:type I restriction enzyme M protein